MTTSNIPTTAITIITFSQLVRYSAEADYQLFFGSEDGWNIVPDFVPTFTPVQNWRQESADEISFVVEGDRLRAAIINGNIWAYGSGTLYVMPRD